ncbi:MAG: hypothetical protein LC781_00735 [Actinobacteria bacterium]|nr:hypothetical protein [Actinomycetota bacterium]
MLTEILADNEAQLQEIMKEKPDLLPVDEFEMSGPLMVVGRETTLPSGAVDLLSVARSGELLLIEFKTGPQNSDFRHVLAQLLDYGSDLWRMSYEEFESTVANRYFSSDRCDDDRLQGKASLNEAARAIWTDLSEEEMPLFRERLTEQLNTGAFHYVVVAQRFTPTMERTIEYLNAITPAARFYAVELVRFAAEGLSAFEARTVLKPELWSSGSRQGPLNEGRFLEQIEDDAYCEALQELLEACRGLGLRLPWGAAGTSIRLQIPGRSQPLSIAWLFPPGVSGWMGLIDLTLGFDAGSAQETPAAVPALEDYLTKVAALPGVETAKPDWASGYHLNPDTVVRHRHQIADILAGLVQRVSEEA